ncbi:MAG: efflux RND transporter periplasmic adaptor subunit [Rhodoferax sp.]
MKARTRHSVVLLLVLLALALGWRVWHGRQTRLSAAENQQKSFLAQVEIALEATDLIALEPQTLTRRIAVDGTVTARNSAWVKARVAGELQGLSVREGETVTAGAVLATIHAPDVHARLTQAREQAQAAKAQVQTAQRALDNNQALMQRGFVSETALTNARAALESALATAAAAQAGADAAAQVVNDTVVRAPLTGQVSQRLVQNGERVAPDARLLEVIDNRALEAVVQLSAAESLQVRPGQRATLHLADGSPPLVAQVVRLNPAADPQSRRINAYLSLPADAGLRHGLFVQGHIDVDQVQGPAVPVSALRTDEPEPYLQWFDGRVVRHSPVTVQARGTLRGEEWAIVSGLPAKAQVLKSSVGRLRDGTPAQLRAPAAAAKTS